MTTTASLPTASTPDRDALPWPALLVLGAATLVMVTGEMLPTAVLPQMSADLGVSEARTGLLVSLWAAVVVVASFPLVRLTRRWSRHTLIAASLVAFAASAAITALAPTYAVALAGRTLGAAAVGLLWSTVNAHVADLVPDRLLGRATAVVLGGATLGMVLGTPVGRFVADLGGWRTSFVLLGVASLVTAALVARVVPARASTADAITGAATGTARPLAPMVAVTLLVAVVLVGHYGAYTFITGLAEEPAALVPGGMGALLLVFGLSSALGVALAGRVTLRTGAALAAATAATAAALLGLAAAGERPAAGVLVVAGWGLVSGALPPLAQTLILRLAGPQRRTLAGALIPVLFNGGIAVGAAAASWLVARDGVGSLPVPSAALVALAAAGLVVVSRARGAGSASGR